MSKIKYEQEEFFHEEDEVFFEDLSKVKELCGLFDINEKYPEEGEKVVLICDEFNKVVIYKRACYKDGDFYASDYAMDMDGHVVSFSEKETVIPDSTVIAWFPLKDYYKKKDEIASKDVRWYFESGQDNE